MTENEISLLEKENPLVQKLLAEYLKYHRSPIADSYITLYEQIMDLNAQLKIDKDMLIERAMEGSDGEQEKFVVTKGKIDLFADKDTKDFERATKYFDNLLKWNETLDKMRGLMTPAELASVKTAGKHDKRVLV